MIGPVGSKGREAQGGAKGQRALLDTRNKVPHFATLMPNVLIFLNMQGAMLAISVSLVEDRAFTMSGMDFQTLRGLPRSARRRC